MAHEITPRGRILGNWKGRPFLWNDGVYRFLDGASTLRDCLTMSDAGYVVCTSDAGEFPFLTRVDDLVLQPGAVSDLRATAVTDTSVTLTWTQVDDGTGVPASYELKYATPPIAWNQATIGCDAPLMGDEIGADISCTVVGLDPDYKTATIGCDPSIEGTEVHADMTCTIEGLEAGTTYDVLLMSYSLEDGASVGARYSNLVTGATSAAAGGPED